MKHEVCGFEHLHRHTHNGSLLDGFGSVEEYASYSKDVNQKYLCITDHGVMGAVPEQIRQCDEHNLFPLLGIELYVNPLQPFTNSRKESTEFRSQLDDSKKKLFDKSHHLLAIAYNNQGCQNLVQMSSWAWIHGYYRKPRVNHEILMKYKEGITFSSCCAISEIAYTFFNYGEDAAYDIVEKYMAMFGEHFILEIMMLDFKLQKPYDQFIIKCHQKYGLKIILSQDVHYLKKEHSKNQRLMLMGQNNRTIQQIESLIASGETDLFELQDENLWMKSEDELNEKWEKDYQDIIDYEIYKEAKRNTIKIAEKSKGVTLDRSSKLPKLPEADEKLKEEIKSGFVKRKLPKTREYIDRIKEEYELITDKEFSSYFLIQQMMTNEARRVFPQLMGWGEGWEAIGPGRGSSAGSLINYCLEITDIDPIRHDLLFSRFLSPTRGGKIMKCEFTIPEL